MTTTLILNIVFAGLTLIAVIGMLTWSISTQKFDALTGQVRSAHRRRRATARAKFVRRTVETRA